MWVKESFRTAIVRLFSLANLKMLLNVTINKITQVKFPIAQVYDYKLSKPVDWGNKLILKKAANFKGFTDDSGIVLVSCQKGCAADSKLTKLYLCITTTTNIELSKSRCNNNANINQLTQKLETKEAVKFLRFRLHFSARRPQRSSKEVERNRKTGIL